MCSAQHLSAPNARGATIFMQRFACRTAQENGDFAEAFWLCSQCSDSMNSLRQLRVSTQLTQNIQDLHDETTMRLHNALQVSCTDFKPEPYSKVIRSSHGQSYALPSQLGCLLSLSITLMAAQWCATQHCLFCIFLPLMLHKVAISCQDCLIHIFCQVLQGFMFLGHVEELGGQVASAFTNAVNTTVVQVTTPSPTVCYSTPGTERLSDSAVLYPSDIVACHGTSHAKHQPCSCDIQLRSSSPWPCCNALMITPMTVQCSMLLFCILHVCMVSKKSQQSVIPTAKRPCICTGGTWHVDDAPRL